MGSNLSIPLGSFQNPGTTEHNLSEIGHSQNAPEMTSPHKTLDEARVFELMHGLQRLMRLQREATSALVDARQKRREASFRRRDVSDSDGKFMNEIQRLTAQGKLEDFEQLPRLAVGCQMTRDDLGPLEQEGIELEQQWEGRVWKLRQATEQLYEEFEPEFSMAGPYASQPTSVASSQYESITEPDVEKPDNKVDGRQMIAPLLTAGSVASSASFRLDPAAIEDAPESQNLTSQSSMLLGMGKTETYRPERESYVTDSDSGVTDIDGPIDTGTPEDLIGGIGPPQQLPKGRFAGIELYPHLITDFGSRRDRINKWLEYMILLSPLEATSLLTVLKERLAVENKNLPSNWSQLVIAYWESDLPSDPHGEKS
jgi:hypothetical protein